MSALGSTIPTLRPARRRAALLLSCGAFALALAAQQASAQAFQGEPSVRAGSVSFSSGPSSDTITVESPTAIVDWDPFDASGTGTIDFLPAGHTATFQNGARTTDFMILNRILPSDPTRAVAFNGTVISQLQTASGTVRGGTVAFYSPGGILIGSTALFDVGNLLLTTIDPIADPNGGFFNGNTFDLRGPVDPNSYVRIEAGAQIRASAENSFVAVASPRVEQFGSVRVNGSTAYVAAEALTLTINNGLFDIIVETGSSSADHTLIHSGSTGGPASGGAGDGHAIYMVAVPKNTAVTALLSGSAGFDPAVSAAVENGEIVLSAGRSVFAGAFGSQAGPASGFTILSGTYTSDVRGSASGDFTAGSPGGSLDFAGDLTVFASGTAHLLARDSTVSVGGNLTLRADRHGDGGGIDVVGGHALITSTGDAAAVRIAGDAVLAANGFGGFDGQTGTVGTGTGGTVRVAADGGAIEIGGDLRGEADGRGGLAETSVAAGGAGTGGSVTLSAANGGRVAVAGASDLSAGGFASAGTGTTGATGTGGSILVAAQSGGSIAATGFVSLAADGAGGAVEAASGTGGTGRGGSVSVAASGGTIGFGGGSEIGADGQGGAGPDGGRGLGGVAAVTAAAGTVTLGGATLLAATGTGGAPAAGGRGGDGAGGSVSILARSGAAASTVAADDLSLFAQGAGADGGGGAAGVAGGRGGDGKGGTVSIAAEALNGNLALGAVYGQAAGFGGGGGAGGSAAPGGRGGDGAGGSTSAGTIEGTLSGSAAGSATFAALELDAIGEGGAGGTGSVAGRGGDAAGGRASLISEGAPVTVAGVADLSASAFAAAGGAAEGGTLRIGARRARSGGEPGLLRAGTLTGSAGGFGDPAAANRAGAWTLFADTGAVEAGGIALFAAANGHPAAGPASAVLLDNGTVTASGTAALESGGELGIEATGSGRLQGATVALSTPSGGIAITHAGRAPGAATLAGGDLAASSRDGFTQEARSRLDFTGTIGIAAGGDVRLSDAQAGEALAADSGGTVTIAGPVAAPEIALRSRNIAILAGGTLGSEATRSVRLEVAGAHSGDGPALSGAAAVIGGTSEGAGYTLDAAEAGRIRTRALAIAAPPASADPARAADIVVRGVAFSGAGGLESVSIATPGRILVEGKLEFANAGEGDTLTLDAGERLQVVTPAGAVLVRDGEFNPAGTLIVRAGDIWVTDAALAGRLAADPGFAGRDAALLANAGPVAPAGYVQAGRAEFYPGKGLFVQNSGTADTLAGITVGTGGLRIAPTGSAPAAVTAFGRGRKADGSFTTGSAFFAAVEFGGSAGFTDDSEFNRCRIVTRACPQPPPPSEPPPSEPPPSEPPPSEPPPSQPPPSEPPPSEPPPSQQPAPPVDLSQASLLGPVSAARPVGAPSPVVDAGALLSQPLIEEPVASGGDGSVWSPGAEEGKKEDEE